MKILNIGSMNIDRVYSVENFVKPKETIKAISYSETSGGKGLNQSVALSRAGAKVFHAGIVGKDGEILLNILKDAGVNISKIKIYDEISGHAMIQVDRAGQNNIIIHGGTNQKISKEYISEVLNILDKNDMVLLQNEISNVDYAIKEAKKRELKIAFNPSPISKDIYTYNLEKVDYFIVNEVEGKAIVNIESEEAEDILNAFGKKFHNSKVILTMGSEGSYYMDSEGIIYQPVYKVRAVDTTGAGDTFCGYFLAGIAKGLSAKECLKYASAASAIEVSKKGAAISIPGMEEVEEFLRSN